MARTLPAIWQYPGELPLTKRMRLVTWNVQWGRGIDGRVDLERIVRTARDMADFDVLCVQEVADHFPALAGSDGSDQFEALAALLPGFQRAQGYGVDAAGEGARRRRFGNAIFSRYAILSIRRHALPWPPERSHSTMPRVAVEATVQAPMGAVRIATTHLEYYSDVQRRAQAVRLRELHEEACQRASQPCADPGEAGTPFEAPPQTACAILTGDFNFRVDDPAYAEIQAPLASGPWRYRDAWRLAHGDRPHAPTFCVHSADYAKAPYCCDFAFVSEALARRVRRVEVDGETQASDHQPVLLVLDDR